MSYDIEIWSVQQAFLPDATLNEPGWEESEDSWILVGETWQLIVMPSVKVLSEDVPEDVLPLLPGIQFLTEITLQPINAPKTAYSLLERVATRIAQATIGIIFDRQNGMITTHTGIKRYQAPRKEERLSFLKMSWWLTDGRLFSYEGLAAFIELLEKSLPEALPRRYGIYEPPQYLYAETGKDHFLQFLRENLSQGVVWYPHRPVLDVNLTLNKDFNSHLGGFRTNLVTVSFESKVLDQPGWPEGLMYFWKAVSQLITPFYGDVRILGGYLREGSDYCNDGKAEEHPVYGPWWRGIPSSLGQAVVLGAPYLSLWPAFAKAGEVSNELAFLSTADWSKKEEISNLIGGVPADIMQPNRSERAPQKRNDTTGSVKKYPPLWPFSDV